MAEAVVEDRVLRFFCHVCNVEVQSVSSEYTCPLCSSGFIEELPANNSFTISENVSVNDVEMEDLDFLATLSSFLNRETRPTDLLNQEENSSNIYFNRDGSNTSGNGSLESRGSSSSSSRSSSNDVNVGTGRRTRRGRLPHLERFDNVLLEILHTLSGGNEGSLGNASMFFMGNPGDYAWGTEGIDTIVTQLLNQMETTGPPPLSKEKIDEIPMFEISNEQINKKLQCSVCWEDFKLQELVRKLSCFHLYHENCIVPWLELHGTCPICRKSLAVEAKNSGTNLHTITVGNTDSDDGQNNFLNRNNANSRQHQATNRSETNQYNQFYTNNNGLGRRLHISLPRFTLFNPERSSVEPLNYDLQISNSRTNNNEGVNENFEQASTSCLQSNPHTSIATQSESTGKSYTNCPNAKKNSGNKSKNSSDSTKNSKSEESVLTSASTSPEATTSNNASHTEVFKFDDGQVDYDFD